MKKVKKRYKKDIEMNKKGGKVLAKGIVEEGKIKEWQEKIWNERKKK